MRPFYLGNRCISIKYPPERDPDNYVGINPTVVIIDSSNDPIDREECFNIAKYLSREGFFVPNENLQIRPTKLK